jgi:hypothetical protein
VQIPLKGDTRRSVTGATTTIGVCCWVTQSAAPDPLRLCGCPLPQPAAATKHRDDSGWGPRAQSAGVLDGEQRVGAGAAKPPLTVSAFAQDEAPLQRQ